MKKLLLLLLLIPSLVNAQVGFKFRKANKLKVVNQAASYVRQNLIKQLDFEQASLTASLATMGGWTKVQDCCALDGSSSCCLRPVIGQVTTHPRHGNNCARFELHKTDPIVSGSVRAEIQPDNYTDLETSELWYGFSVYLENWATDDFGESVPIQWQDVDGSCPPLSIQSYDDHLHLKQCINGGTLDNDLGSVPNNQWIDFVIHVKWSASGTISSGSGQIQLWMNGTKLVDKNNIRTNSTGGSYLKFGMNKFNWDGTSGLTSSQTQRIFYVDDFRMSNTVGSGGYNDVDPSTP